MKQSRYSNSQIMSILKQAESGIPVPTLCREHGMSSATFYKWRAKNGRFMIFDILMYHLKRLETLLHHPFFARFFTRFQIKLKSFFNSTHE